MTTQAEQIVATLRSWANSLAARFGTHVYLCGSALTKAEPRDAVIAVLNKLTAIQENSRC